MKILITGGAGFIGSNFIYYMLERDHQIINVDVLTYAGNLENLEECKKYKNYFFYKVDVCEQSILEEILIKHKPDVIVHMAAESHVDRSIDCADDFIKTNIFGTYSLLNAALTYYKTIDKKENFRFIHISTDEVFGALGLQGKFNESMPYKPNSPYAASKASSDHLVRAYKQTYDLPTIIINSSNNYGPKQYPEKLIPLTILNALEWKRLPIYGDGQQVRDWLYVEDHVKAIHAVIEHGRIGASYCVGGDNEITNLMLVEKICEMLDEIRPDITQLSYKQLISFVKNRPGHDFRYATDASLLKKDTGWQPSMSFEQGLAETVAWYMQSSVRLGNNKDARKRIGLG